MGEDDGGFADINKKLTEIMDALEIKLEKQAEIIFKQELYLEGLDRKERRSNLVILGVPDEQEYHRGAVNNADKLQKVWGHAWVRHRRWDARQTGKRFTRLGKPPVSP